MFSDNEIAEIRMVFYNELVNVHKLMLAAGSYQYLCLCGGRPVYSHTPIGKVLWHQPWM